MGTLVRAMPSPFPGMDPYVEAQLWPGFHTQMIAGLQARLVPLLRPSYLAMIEERVYIETAPESLPRTFCPDVRVTRAPTPGGALTVVTPVQVPLPEPERLREPFLEIRRRDGREVVTVLEVLSPSNKRAGSTGRREYLSKRQAVLESRAHLVELDLLRGGERLPMAVPLPAGDYCVIVSRAERRPIADVWPFTLKHRLPVIPLPLGEDDADVQIDLQDLCQSVYDNAGLDYSLDYSQPLNPFPTPEVMNWIEELLRAPEGPDN